MTAPSEAQVKALIDAIASARQTFSFENYGYKGPSAKPLPVTDATSSFPVPVDPSSTSSPSTPPLTPINKPPDPLSPTTPNPLSLASDVFSLLKAYTTKLGLLAINAPFTPTAITRILHSLQSELLPPLILAESCPASIWTSYLHITMESSTRAAFFELRTMLSLLPTCPADVTAIVLPQRSQSVLKTVGVIHDCCDGILRLAANGIGELAVKHATEWYELLQDTSREIADWREEGMQRVDDDDDFFESTEWSDDDATFTDDKDTIPLPKSPPAARANVPAHILALTTAIQAFIQHLQKIYPPLIKRRLKRFPAPTRTSSPSVWPTPAQCEAFDAMMFKADRIPGNVDDLTVALYKWNLDGEDGVSECIRVIKHQAKELAGVMVKGWDAIGKGEEMAQDDKVGEWVRQWTEMLEKWEFPGTAEGEE